MISDFQKAFVPLQKSLIASSSMAFARAGVAGLMPLRGATNAVALQNSQKGTRGLRDDGIDAIDGMQCERAATMRSTETAELVYRHTSPPDSSKCSSSTVTIDRSK